MVKTDLILEAKQVPLGEEINNIVATATTTKATGATLTLKTLQKAYKELKKYEDRRQKEIQEMVSSPDWQNLYHKLHQLLGWLHEKDRLEDYAVVIKCIWSIDPSYRFPVHPKVKEKCEELIKEFDSIAR